jgi:NAD(P)-dependent dehydrogenase (short-subunit alcohol dehydrogenase family)
MARKYDIEGRTVFITGAARGIGAAVAERFHSRGANVALVGLEPDRLEALAERLGERAAWCEADVTDLGALQRAADDTAKRFGGIDVAIANAGVHFIGSVATAPVEMFEREIEVNLLGVWRTDRAVLPYVTERQGYLLNVASLAACSHAPLMGAYAASKSGVEGLTNSLRQELAPTGARAGCAYFGFIDTDIVRGAFSHPSSQALESLMPRFVRNAVPLPKAVEAIENGVERRASKVWAPRYVGGALAFRGVIQPVVERWVMRSRRLPEALRLAEPVAGGVDKQDLLLGVAAEALPKRDTAGV